MKTATIGILTLTVLFSSCRIADLRTDSIKENQLTEALSAKGNLLIKNAIEKQGFDKIDQYKTYEAIGSDHWKGLLGKIGTTWKWKKEKMAMRYTIGDFDGQVEVLEGKKKGFIAGIQSFDYYEIENGKYDSNVKDQKRIMFGLAAYHYFFEIGARLKNASVIQYIGEETFKEEKMHKVFASWGTERTKDYDQYVLFIGDKSGLVEAVSHTVRDAYLPGSGPLHSSTRFDDYREVGGVMIPFSTTVQIFDVKDNINKYLHQFTLSSFSWDAVDEESIRPNKTIKSLGDDKPTS